MQKRSRMPRDPSKLAKLIVDMATRQAEPEKNPYEGKDPAAVALGRKGGRKGGPARAANMTPEQRSESARTAVTARWAKLKKQTD